MISKKRAELSKKLKAFHMVANRPENMFFVIYSNLPINKLEDFIDNDRINFNYKMNNFTDEEIELYREEIEENIKKLKNLEIFDENLYKHGIFYKSSINHHILDVFFHIGNVDYKDLQFFISDYYEYLFNSKSLKEILLQKGYLASLDKIHFEPCSLIENNNVMELKLDLSKKGVENLDDVLLIIYKYVDIMKEEGYKEEYFKNYMQLKTNQMNINFNKDSLFSPNDIGTNILGMIEIYRRFGEEYLLMDGTPPKMIEEEKLKKYLQKIKYEKSFFTLNTNLTNYTKIFSSTENRTIKYYNLSVIYGNISKEFEEKVNSNEKYKGLEMREINPYISKLMAAVTPCYDTKENNCEELNEYDIYTDEGYTGVVYKNESGNYITSYQIDKSSETYIVKAYLKINYDKDDLLKNLTQLLKNYFTNKFNDFNELGTTTLFALDDKHISIILSGFYDSMEKSLTDLIQLFQDEPKELERLL